MQMKLPLLVIQEELAFWVQHQDPSISEATLQAFQEGCFRSAYCYDQDGGLWPIAEAVLRAPPTLLQRILPWRKVQVRLTLGHREAVELKDIVARLAAILKSDSEFCDFVEPSPEELLEQFEKAKTPQEIIQIAEEQKRYVA